MASIRRTLSPHPERHNQNGTFPSGESTPPHRLSKASPESSLPFLTTMGVGLGRFLASISLVKHQKKPQASWRRSLTRCLLFFLFGVLLGMTPFGHVNDLQTHDFSFEIKPPLVNTQMEVKTDSQDGMSISNINRGVQLQGAIFGLNPEEKSAIEARKQLIVVTPTYNRALQAYFLNRVGQVLRLVRPPLLWIVVEMNAASMETAEILRNTGVMYRHLVCTKNTTNLKDRGVHQRNTALEHIQLHHLDGIVYFADDDNIYSLELFESLRLISRFGTWPVAMLAPSKNKVILEGPVCNESQVIGWHTNEKSKRLRRFHADMSGFAFNSTIIWDPKRWGGPTLDPIRQLDTVREGFQETTFIEQLVEDERQMEAILPSCSRIMNWHLHLDVYNLLYPKGWKLQKNLDAVIPIM